MSDKRRYRQVLSVVEQPWAILPSTLMVIREVVARHLAGERLSAAEIEARVGAGKSRPEASGGKVAVVPLWGVLVPHAGMMVDVSQEGTGLDAWLQGFREAMANPEVGSILLHVDSPGGSTGLVHEVATEVRAARAQKPIYAVADTLAASAAYYIASQADKLYVTPSGMVGSIGVYTVHEDLSARLEAEGVKPTVISAPEGGHKFENSPFGPLSEEAQAHLQGQVNDLYDMFVGAVAQGRGTSRGVVEAQYGQGRTLNSRAALAAGMVDGIASYDQVLAAMLKGKQLPQGGSHALAHADTNTSPDEAIAAVLAEVGLPAGTQHIFSGSVRLAEPTTTVGASAEYIATTAVAAELPATTAPTHTIPTQPTQGGSEMEPEVAEAPAAAPTTPTVEQHAARLDAIRARQGELDTQAAGREMNDEEQGEFDALTEEFMNVERTIRNLNERKAHLARTAPPVREQGIETDRAQVYTNVGRSTPENLHDLAAYRQRAKSLDEVVGLWREGAKRVNEQMAYEGNDPDRAKAFVEQLLARDSSAAPKESFAHRILTAGDPVYEAAWTKHLLGVPLTAHEEATFKAAVSNTGLGAESPVPITIDPTVILTSDGSTNPLRAIARTVTITGNTWQGISSEGVSVAYEAEMTTVADQTPDFDAPTAEVQKAHGWVEFSIEVDQDWGAFRSELGRMFADAKDVKEAEKFLFGTGTNEPQGLLSFFDADDAEEIDSDTVNAIGLVDFEAVAGDLPPRFDANARWLANKGVYASIRALAGAAGRIDVWVPLAQGFPQSPGGSGALPYTLLGYPVNVASDMSKALTTGGAEVAILGDFGRGFIIVDRVGLNTELVPLVPQTGGRPRGTRGLYVYFRNTSQVIARNAFRILRVATT